MSDAMVGPHAPGVMEQAVDDELVLFNPTTDSYFTLNRSAREVWELADGTRSAAEIAEELANRYELSVEELAADVGDIVASFNEANLI